MIARNRSISPIRASWCALLLISLFPLAASAGRVELLLNASKGTPITAMQDWTRALGAAGVRNVRVQNRAKPPRPTIETRDLGGLKTYLVSGIIDGNGNILLPGKRFRSGDAKRLAAWLDDIAKNGPLAEREPIDKFGLSLSMTKKVAADLAKPINFKTEGSTRASVLLQIEKITRFPILAPKRLMATLDKTRVTEDLKGFTAGTVLTYLIEPFGLGLYPSKGKDGKLQYLIVERSTKNVEPWPIGWKPKNRMKALPELFKTRGINLERIPIVQVLEAISKRLEVPLLIDQAALARERIDLTKETATFSQERTDFDRTMSSMLFKVKLQYQFLIDDAGHPFLWVTTRNKK